MTGHRPDQPGAEDPSDSASQNAGADVSADEFAAALKLIVTRLDGQDDGGDSPPPSSDADDGLAAVPPTGVLNAAADPPREETPWTGLSDTTPMDTPAPEPEAPSPLSGGSESSPAGSGQATTAADLWPTSSPPPDARSESPDGGDPLFADATSEPGLSDPLNTPMPESAGEQPEPPRSTTVPGTEGDSADSSAAEPAMGEDPLFADKPEGAADPLAAFSSDAGGAAKEPLFAEPQTGPGESGPPASEPAPATGPETEPLFVDPAASSNAGDAPVSSSADAAETGQEPLFVDTGPAGGAGEAAPTDMPAAREPLFVDKPTGGDSEPLFVETPQAPSPESAASDPMADLRNKDDGPTIGPAMPAPEASAEVGESGAAPLSEPLFADAGTPPVQEPPPQSAASAPDVPAAGGQAAEAPGGLGGAPNDPFASAARPAFEDERANALFGDAPDLAAQNAPGSSLGPIGAEAEDFGKDKQPKTDDAPPLSAKGPAADGNGAAELVATRDLDDDPEGSVELDEILPPLDPAEAASLEKAAGLPKPKRRLNVGAPIFWLLILAIVGGISFWGYQQRQQVAAVGDWAQARYALPTGQLAALFSSDPAPEAAAPAPEAPEAAAPAPEAPEAAAPAPEAPEAAAPVPDAPEAPGAPQPTAAPAPAEPEPVRPVAAQPPPEPQPQVALPAPEPTPPVVEPAPAPAPQPVAAAEPTPEPEPAAEPPPQPQVSEPVAVAAAAPPALPEHLAPLPPDATPQTRALTERARSGDAVAQHDLANRYAIGDGVSQNTAYAAYWYRLAAEAGIANAQYNLGVLTTRGLGVRQDHAAAFELFHSAAAAGHADAQTATGLALMHGVGVAQDRLQAASWFQAASANGRPRGAFHLGQLFELGLDEAPDLAAAAGWYRIAADAGYDQARESLDRLTAATRAQPSPPPAPAPVAAPETTPTPVPPRTTPVAVAPSELVREIQQLLNGFGYDAGPEDGVMGAKTEEAIRAFERSQGFYITGEATNGIRDILRLLSENR